jgi:hypothetical protein
MRTTNHFYDANMLLCLACVSECVSAAELPREGWGLRGKASMPEAALGGGAIKHNEHWFMRVAIKEN